MTGIPALAKGQARKASVKLPRALSKGEETFALRKCAHCGIEFRPKRIGERHKGRFCSRECFTGSARKARDCIVCGKAFFPTKRQKRCSPECRDFSGKNNPSWSGGKVKHRCRTCGIEYERFASAIGTYCGKKCASKGFRGQKIASDNPNFRGGEEIPCVVCGKSIWRHPSRPAKAFCSTECFHKARFGPGAPRANKSRWGSTSSKAGTRADLGIFVRSSWEANYARYLNWLKAIGEILDWGYEVETFEFVRIKRGTRFYTPDFKVEVRKGEFEYHEVKGWMHPKGKTALARMARYYPEIKIILIQQKEYRALRSSVGTLIKGWE